eukprot:403339966
MQSKLGLCFVLASMFLIQQTLAIETFSQCLNCFYTNRTAAYYCQSNQQCLPTKSPQCATSQMVLRNYQCMEGFAECTNMTFTSLSTGQITTQGYGLLPGYGCYIRIERLEDGSIGTLTLQFDDPAIKVFDDYNLNYKSGQQLGLLLAESGWTPRQVFVVNTGEAPAGFTAVYSSSIKFMYSVVFGIIAIVGLINFI